MENIEYTIARHVENLKKMLELDEPCLYCPGSEGFSADLIPHPDACKICREFVGLSPDDRWCPCQKLGPTEALERTRVAIHKYESNFGRE